MARRCAVPAPPPAGRPSWSASTTTVPGWSSPRPGVADGDEVAAFAVALDCLPDLAGHLVTADALHCQRRHADFLTARGGHYLFTVRANQPTLRQALRRLPWAAAPGSRRRGRGHGRTESRSIKVIDCDGTDIPQQFPAARRAIKVVRRRATGDGRRSVETVYALTSLDHRAADPALLAAWLRGHWGSRTGSTTSAMSPSVKTPPASGPATQLRS